MDGDEHTNRLTELRTSARGWHGVQLAVLGFIGLCGVLQGDAGMGNPGWLRWLAGLLVLVSLVLACVATALVATAAWPVSDAAWSRVPGGDDDAEFRRTFVRLRTGIVITFVAVAVLAVATTSAWWPGKAPQSGLVEVVTTESTWCGELSQAPPGVMAIDVDGRRVAVAISDVGQVLPADRCP